MANYRDRLVTVVMDGEMLTHLPGAIFDYATLCGMDGNDDARDVNQSTIPTPLGARVNCDHCRLIWEECRNWRTSDFTKAS